VKDPDNYLILNFASDSIKKDAKILQLTYMHKDEMYMSYVSGGNPRLNDEFTGIPALIYEEQGMNPSAVESDFVDFINEEEIDYLVYNNVFWNQRLVQENGWTKLLTKFGRLPCFAMSDYETARRLGDNLFDYNTDNFAKVCDVINARAKSAPKGFRPSIYTNYYERDMEEGSIPTFTTESEKLTFCMNAIMKNILDRTKDQEAYDV
jgi:hypothetical protein